MNILNLWKGLLKCNVLCEKIEISMKVTTLCVYRKSVIDTVTLSMYVLGFLAPCNQQCTAN